MGSMLPYIAYMDPMGYGIYGVIDAMIAYLLTNFWRHFLGDA